MLVPDFYNIIEFDSTEDKVEAQITLNKDHSIYEGHFPGQPVVPGVMQLQIIKELVEKATGRELLLSEASSVKYLNMIDPHAYERLRVEIKLILTAEGQIKANALITAGELVYTKVRCLLSSK